METVGVIAVCVVLAGAAAGVIVGVRSLPDVRRYLKIRRM
ncbi:DUF6893 family small protein [Nocardia bovistercoris]